MASDGSLSVFGLIVIVGFILSFLKPQAMAFDDFCSRLYTPSSSSVWYVLCEFL